MIKARYSVNGVTSIASFLSHNTVISSLSIQCTGPDLLALAPGIQHTTSLLSLTLEIFDLPQDSTITEFTQALLVNQTIRELSLNSPRLTLQQWETIFSTLQTRGLLQKLSFAFSPPPTEAFMTSFTTLLANYLRHNNSLKSLSLDGSCSVNKNSKLIPEALAENRQHVLEALKGVSLSTRVARKALGLDQFFRRKNNETILKYLKELRNEGVTTVRRMKLIFAGNGEVGKSTLIKRLKEGKFEENSQIMTDGIDISYFNIGEIEMSVFDFAGQPEYEHTHSLFFDQNSIYLLLYSVRASGQDRLKIFQQMILNSVPNATIIFVTTRADEARLTSEEVENILEDCPNIVAVVPIDSKSGTGIRELEEVLVETAMKKEQTMKSIPTSFERLRQSLQQIGESQFSISADEIRGLCVTQLDFKAHMVDLALELFLSWGYIFRLSNGDYVLQPQALADVMACVFSKLESTKSRIGDVREGVLRHSNDVLDAVWMNKFPTLSKSMWRCTSDTPVSPFLSLLYQAGLAFALFDSQSKPIGASLVPGLLPLHPCGFQNLPSSKAPYHEKLCQLFVPHSLETKVHPRVMISFKDGLPTSFMGRLQVKLRRMATLGGAWKRGCCLVLQSVDATDPTKKIDPNGPQNTDQANVSSLIILHQSRDDVVELISAGDDTSARSTALSLMLTLMEQQFPCAQIISVKIQTPLREYGPHDLLENFAKGFILHSCEKIHIGSLRILEPALRLSFPSYSDSPSLEVSPPQLQKVDVEMDLSLSFCVDSNPFLSLCPPNSLRKLKDLELMVATIERTSVEEDQNDDGDYVFVSDKLLACIPAILHLMGLRHSRRKGLSTLWVILATKGGQ
jgi:GTPase SAR1 family protein